MNLWILISGILTPALFWFGYFYYKDRFRPEPLNKIGMAYLMGIASALACLQIMRLAPAVGIPYDPSTLMEGSRFQFLLYSICITGLLEEFCKFLPFLVFVLSFRSFDEKTDGILYSSFIALGFASYENILLLPHLEGFELFGRAITSPLTHTIFSSLWGYTMGIAHMQGRSRIRAGVLGMGLAALCHGVFNFLTTSSALRIFSSLLILVIWVWRICYLEKCEKARMSNT